MKTHGMSKTPEFRAWLNMKERCYRPTNARYHRYGARGIEVCDRWLESFENFYTDIGDRPSPTHSLDRIDNDGNYEPDNCRWGTREEQYATMTHPLPKSRLRGVSKYKNGWRAEIWIKGRKFTTFTYDSPDKAAEMRKFIAREWEEYTK